MVSLAVILMIIASLSNVSSSPGGVKDDTQNEPEVVKERLLIESAKITDIGMQAAKEILQRAFHENITEAAVAREAAQAMVDSGSSEFIEAFGVMVASGEQSALPHGDSSDDETNLILPGEVVVVDLGARYRGYCTDLTRTFFMGEPTAEMMEVYNITMEAQAAGIKAVRTGVLARDVDKAARDIIKGYGYGENFTHGLGHGIGVYIHMPPTLDPNSMGVLFESGDMAITIEPGIYLTGRWGVRIEDDVMVTRRGFEIITHSPTGLDEAILYPSDTVNITDIRKDEGAKSNENSNNSMLYGVILIVIIALIVLFLSRKQRFRIRLK
ncbi:M24 family metallopeptidase [[Eubacterium] cellulosolvens]